MNECLDVIHQYSCYTSHIVPDPAFYNRDSLLTIRTQIKSFFGELPPSSLTRVYLSSQMHCLAGALSDGQEFISTWNDLPIRDCENTHLITADGIPLLHSMPPSKLSNQSETLYISTSGLKRMLKRDSAEIAYVASPLSLVLSSLFRVRIPCSQSWWQSSCLPVELLTRSSDSTTYQSELGIHHSDTDDDIGLGLNSQIFVYPEIGDLQASTYSAIQNNDIIINLGTGSQVVCKKLQNGGCFPFYRYWPANRDPLPTISHIPCGRLLVAYSHARGIEIADLITCLNLLKPEDVIRKAFHLPNSLLFFPGYCFQHRQYFQRPPVSIEMLAELDPELLVSLWVYQYVSVVQDFLSRRTFQSENYSIAVTGNLGGIATHLVRLLSGILSGVCMVTHDSSELNHSIVHAFHA